MSDNKKYKEKKHMNSVQVLPGSVSDSLAKQKPQPSILTNFHIVELEDISCPPSKSLIHVEKWEINTPQFISLPIELLVLIFSFLPIQSLFHLFSTCQSLSEILRSDVIWRVQFFELITHEKFFLVAKELLPICRFFHVKNKNCLKKHIAKLPRSTLHSLRSQVDNHHEVLHPFYSIINSIYPEEHRIEGFTLFDNQAKFERLIERVKTGGFNFSFIRSSRRNLLSFSRREQLEDLETEFVRQCTLMRIIGKEQSKNFNLHVIPFVVCERELEEVESTSESAPPTPIANQPSTTTSEETSPRLHVEKIMIKNDNCGPNCTCFFELCECVVRNKQHFTKIDKNMGNSLKLKRLFESYRNYVYPLLFTFLLFAQLCLASAYFEFWNKPSNTLFLGMIWSLGAIANTMFWVLAVLGKF